MFFFLVNSWGQYRNSGFMWEPAAFGAVLAWAMLINLFIYRFKINSHLIILLIASLTTFSIGAYIYLSILAFVYIIKNFGNKHAFGFLFLILLVILMSLRFQFVQENIERIRRKIAIHAVTKNGHTPAKMSSSRTSGSATAKAP